jgi:hypothetical protein
MLTQDCAPLVLGYYPISLREKNRRQFRLSLPVSSIAASFVYRGSAKPVDD